MYANDTQLYMSFNEGDGEKVLKQIELCIEDIRCWMRTNLLKLYYSNTVFLVISKKGCKVANPSTVQSVSIGNDHVEAVSSAKNIGAFIDNYFTMEHQVSYVCKNCYIGLYQISQIRSYITQDAAAIIVSALVTSKLDCLNSLLYGIPDYQLKRLQLVQNNAARVVTGTKRSENITPVLKKLHWLPIVFRIDYKILLLCFKALNGQPPKYLSELLVFYVPQRNLRSTGQNLLVEPKARLKTYGDRAFSVCAPKLWNKLPEYMRNCDDLNVFKLDLKTYLFKKAFAHC